MYLSVNPPGFLQYLEMLGNARLCKGQSIDDVPADAPVTGRFMSKDIDNLYASGMSNPLGKLSENVLAFFM